MIHSLQRVALTILLGLPSMVCAQTPTYQTTVSDPTWAPIVGGSYLMSTSAENYPFEIWERPIEDNKLTISGGTMTTTGKYYSYGDLQQGAYGVDATYLYASLAAAGDFFHDVGQSPVSVGLKSRYNFYFGITGAPTKRFLLTIDDGSSVGTGSFGSIGKIYQDANGDVLGSGLTVTFDSSGGTEKDLTDGFESEIAAGSLLARRTGNTIELAVDFAALGLIAADFNQLSFAYAGLATSNPSGSNDIFANDEFAFAPGSGVEYDTLMIVPEPGSAVLMAAGMAWLLLTGRQRREGVTPRVG